MILLDRGRASCKPATCERPATKIVLFFFSLLGGISAVCTSRCPSSLTPCNDEWYKKLWWCSFLSLNMSFIDPHSQADKKWGSIGLSAAEDVTKLNAQGSLQFYRAVLEEKRSKGGAGKGTFPLNGPNCPDFPVFWVRRSPKKISSTHSDHQHLFSVELK